MQPTNHSDIEAKANRRQHNRQKKKVKYLTHPVLGRVKTPILQRTANFLLKEKNNTIRRKSWSGGGLRFFHRAEPTLRTQYWWRNDKVKKSALYKFESKRGNVAGKHPPKPGGVRSLFVFLATRSTTIGSWCTNSTRCTKPVQKETLIVFDGLKLKWGLKSPMLPSGGKRSFLFKFKGRPI